MKAELPPLTPTVAEIFDAFVVELAEKKLLTPAGIEALRETLSSQKLDANSLRRAIFTASEPSK